nr:uncharacterized protein At1g51745 isoform X1 [Ipomoea batatas]
MGSSETEQGMVDCGVGSIVWVRRRNGSWWPGKILGPDELSASHVMSPRSGTPVKLLGREDASVDWYNLEKSKRVKAFRCGEFDDCIERAEASLGMPPKKREKYARREDAILHALELERELVGKKYGKISYSSNNKIDKSSDNTVTREAVASSKQSENQNGEEFHLKSQQAFERDGLSLKDDSRVGILCVDITQKGNQLSRDNDNSSVPSRMRDLQDFGLSSVPAEDELPVSTNGASKSLPDSNILLGGSPKAEVNVDRESLLAEETPAKRHDKRRPLVQVLQTSEKFPVSYLQQDVSSGFMSVLGDEPLGGGHAKKARYTYLSTESGDHFSGKINLPSQIEISTPKLEGNAGPQPAGSCEANPSVSTEYTETDSPESDSQESDTDDNMATLSEGAASIELQPKYLGRSEAPAEHGSTSSEELDDLSGADSHPFLNDTVSAGVGVSKWQLKGKRNNRNLVKRSLDAFEANHFRTASYMIVPPDKGSGGSEATSFIKSTVTMAGYGSRVGNASRSVRGDLPTIDRHVTKGYWGDSGENLDSMCNYHHLGGQTMLVDVELKVQASYHRQRVPMISLMSKINGQAIVGHPIQIEALEDGASQNLLGALDVFPETLSNDTSLQPVWRTARRTAGVRVPRPNISSGLDGTESSKHPLAAEGDRNVRRASSDGFGQKPSTMRKNTPRPPVVKTFTRKTPKRISLSSNQKIRTLSSISSQQKQSGDLKRSSNIFQVDGIMKQDTVPTVIACIPVKLVFSRLNEELVGRPK